MAFITLSGTLLDPNGDLAVGDQIRFTHKSTAGNTVEGAVSIITINPAGTYSFPLQYGLVLVEYKDVRTQQFKNLGVATVNSTNPATSIPELLNALVPASSAELIEFQDILANCVTSQTAAENAANTAEAFAYQLTTTDLIASTATFAAETNIPTSGFTTSGDGGNGSWKQTGTTGQTPSQSPAQLGDALLNDGNGNQWSLVGTSLNVLQLGAIIGGVTDALAVFSAAGKSAFKSIYITGGQFLLSATPETVGGVTWNVARGVSFTGTGSLEINAGKDKILSLGDYRSIESDPSFHSGIFGYLEQNSALTAYGNLGLHGSAYTSWRGAGESGADIGVSGFSAQDKVGNIKGAWSFYGTSVRESGVNAAAFGMELDIANMGDIRPIFPHGMFNPGQTQALWLGAGGEIAEIPEVVGVASVAIGIISNDPANNAKFEKGIVFGATSLEGSDGETGNSIAVAMAPHQSISYYNTSNGRVGDIRCTTQNTTDSQRLEFTDDGVEVKGLNDGRTQFRVERVNNADSFLLASASSGVGGPALTAVSLNTDSDIAINPKGAGKIRIGYTSQAATTPSNFVANRYIEIKDSAGVTMYMPVSMSPW